MNALRDIDTVQEIDVRLQTNEVLVHLPHGTALGEVPQAIHSAGYAADDEVWLLARGRWVEDGFLPHGWSDPLPAVKPADAEDGEWELHFQKRDDRWEFNTAASVDEIPQIEDEDTK